MYKSLTRESWNDNPRGKILLPGNKICYYVQNKPDEEMIKHELNMMNIARSAGLNIPKVGYYEKNKGFEICMMEYIKGRKANFSDLQKIKNMIQVMKSIESDKCLFYNNILLSNTRSNFWKHIVNDINSLAKLFNTDNISQDVKNIYLDETPVFSHGDISFDNMIITDDNSLYLIDWEQAGFFPKDLYDEVCIKEPQLKTDNIINLILRLKEINKANERK